MFLTPTTRVLLAFDQTLLYVHSINGAVGSPLFHVVVSIDVHLLQDLCISLFTGEEISLAKKLRTHISTLCHADPHASSPWKVRVLLL